MFATIYFDNRPLFLCDRIDETIEPFLHHDDAIFIDELNSRTVKTMIHEMQTSGVHAGVFQHGNFRELFNEVVKKFSVIKAAGGLVRNDEGKLLLIFRRGKWDLPKGKLEENEEILDCALREVSEETNVKDITITAPLLVTYHTYHEGSRFVLKASEWFFMEARGVQKVVPQTDEDITELRWIDQQKVLEYLPQSFALIEDVLKTARQKGFIAY